MSAKPVKKKGKPGEYPVWLFDKEKLYDRPVCMWTCVCGAPYFFAQVGKRHGGPRWRIDGHPEWSPAEGPCWRSRVYGVKCVTPKGISVLTHEGYEPPSEEQLQMFYNAGRSQRRRYKDESTPAVYDALRGDGLIWWIP